ncbi:gnat family n-acetyltransferase [Ophiostoma piceae UAMH 11346]|uniref:Gnat family n-acetyltransferase n=1 Tax=Ophiostoma piceae (strain UAMH 11346) TaxID=1262450 RepID=S3C6N6_OPHP1|nr:gnat family n-acetyltransferase [Ophiostoma piceae UAMH 11346]
MASSATTPPLTWRTSVDVSAEATASGKAQKEEFICSTDPALLQLDALSDALASELLWWAQPLDAETLQILVQSSVCIGLYHTATDDTKHDTPKMVGFSRLVTDRVTFAYLTDVYVLPEFQKRGLGAWMVRCLRELVAGTDGAPSKNGGENGPLREWAKLRSLWLLCTTPIVANMYTKALGMECVARYRSQPGVPDSGQFLLEMRGPANALKHYAQRSNDASGWKADN